ncbi:MAG: siderophore-interacting protein [Pseudomonadota bacterium]
MSDILYVKEARRITPNMIRVTLTGERLVDFPTGREGGNCKIFVPDEGETVDDFGRRLAEKQKVTKRTYTVRAFRKESLELDIDFVAHGDDGPASRWANKAKPGSFCGFRGASLPKVQSFYADFYLLAADMSALPVASATLEAMPRDAKGFAVFEIHSEADRQEIAAPSGVSIKWIVNPDTHQVSMRQLDEIRALDWPQGSVQTCIAGESNTIKAVRQYLYENTDLNKKDAYISGYWKVGLIEDEHQIAKKKDAA